MSLEAIVEAIVGLGSSPIHINMGRNPWRGVKLGHVTDTLFAAGSAKTGAGTDVATAALRASNAVLELCFTDQLSRCVWLTERLWLRPRVPPGANGTLCCVRVIERLGSVISRHNDEMSI